MWTEGKLGQWQAWIGPRTYRIRDHSIAGAPNFDIYIKDGVGFRWIGRKPNLRAARAFVARHVRTGYEMEN